MVIIPRPRLISREELRGGKEAPTQPQAFRAMRKPIRLNRDEGRDGINPRRVRGAPADSPATPFAVQSARSKKK